MLREILLAATGATGFAVIFGMKRTNLISVWIVSALSWATYRFLCLRFDKNSMAMFLITLLVILVSKIITYYIKCPVFLFSTPVLIPFIPGASLYYVMDDIINQNENIIKDAQVLGMQVAAMALGIFVAEMMLIILAKIVLVMRRYHQNIHILHVNPELFQDRQQ